ncbi:MAG: hypothetical protein M1434_06480 [Chloroflexi bacterium]|nr:hypothetical protein [Chloroflexota bacterium]MCL5274379.1 hypothetical protein [Chloroflexota bacterium]
MTNDLPILERPAAPPASATVAEPSMFDAPEWVNGGVTAPRAEMRFAGVRFQHVGKVYHYIADGFNLKVGDWVIVDTQRGKQMGQVATLRAPRGAADLGAFKRIERLAGGRDMVMRHYYETRELEAMIACRAESNALGLPIKIVKAEYSFDGQTLMFLFSSDQEERVETNDLRQVMSRLYRARIEMRQISPREVAKIIGGMGACGIEQRCCSRFLTDFSPISIKHAKEQGLSLNPHDITGMCGRLRCCLIFEYEQYVEARRRLPKKNAIVGTPAGQGKVIDLLPLRDSVLVLVGEGEAAKGIVVHREQIIPLEELKRLQEKAASGTCDKHEGGECDCGKNQPAAAQGAAETGAGAKAPIAAQEQGVSRAQKHKNKSKRPAGAGEREGQASREMRGAQDGAGNRPGQPGERTEQRRAQPARHKHHHEHADNTRRSGENAPAPDAPQQGIPQQSAAEAPANRPDTPPQALPLRRPLRRPLQRRPPPEKSSQDG